MGLAAGRSRTSAVRDLEMVGPTEASSIFNRASASSTSRLVYAAAMAVVEAGGGRRRRLPAERRERSGWPSLSVQRVFSPPS